MRKREADTAVYSSRNNLVSAFLREPFPNKPGEPLSLTIRMLPAFIGRLKIKEGGQALVVECSDIESKDALLGVLQGILMERDLDERKWRDVDERKERERREGGSQ